MKIKRFINLGFCAALVGALVTCDGGREEQQDPTLSQVEAASRDFSTLGDEIAQAGPVVAGLSLPDEGERHVDLSGGGDCRLMGSYPCGTCDPSCRTEGIIDPTEEGSIDGLVDNPDGPGLIIGADVVNAPYAWISHNLEGAVSKIDLRDGRCAGKYKVGQWGNAADSPSRTTVDGLGNAYIANRAYSRVGSVTKIAGDPARCVDKDGDTVIETSSSCSNVRALNQDECVLWTTPIPAAGTCSDGSLRGIVVDFGDGSFPEGYVWVGSTCNNKFFKLRPDTGAVIDQIQIDVPPYGAAIDSAGWVWSTRSGGGDAGGIQAFNSVTKTKLPYIPKPGALCGIGWGYGITIDLQDRIWITSWGNERRNDGKPCGYNQLTGSWITPPDSSISCGKFRGIAIDMTGDLWTSCWEDGTVWRIDPDTGNHDIMYVGCGPLGIGADFFGKVWIANADCRRATRIDPITLTQERFTTGAETSYTYSDFTGVQRALRNPRGQWVRIFERCDGTPMDKWNQISWSVTTPSNSKVTIYGKSSDDLATITSAPQIVVANVPPTEPPLDLQAVFSDARVYLGRYVEVGVVLESSSDGLSPVFLDLFTTYNCY
jgi:streptogramin lyase